MTVAPSVELPIIGYVRSPLIQKFGTPRQPNLVNVPAIIEFVPPFGEPLAFEGLAAFSHIWLLWQFHQNRDTASTSDATITKFRAQVRPPRLGGNQKIGVFATRSMYRPANIGLSVVQLVDIEPTPNGVRLHIVGGDMVDGTPIIDIKPYINYSDSIADARSGFAEHKPIRKQVSLTLEVQRTLTALIVDKKLTQSQVDIICELLAQDPRPAYRQHEHDTIFTMRYRDWDIAFMQIDEQQLQWVGIVALNAV